MIAAKRKLFGERVRELREAKRISQTALSKNLGVSHSYVSHLEAGRRVPSVALLYTLAARLGGTAGGYLP